MPVSHVRLVKHGDEVTIGGIRVSCLFTPCHTTGHICYYVTQVSLSECLAFIGLCLNTIDRIIARLPLPSNYSELSSLVVLQAEKKILF